MQIAMFKSIYEYNHWADERLLQTVATLDEAALHGDMPNGVGSIHVTLVHMVSGLWVWRQRCAGNVPNAMLSPADFPTLDSIVTRWREEERLIHEFLATLHDEDLAREVRYGRIKAPDKVFVLPLWQILLHLANHLTQHRSEVAMKLTELGHSPGELGMSTFFNG